ncbi:GIY-YIG nuclease superfamily protein [bacterium BMS3Abin06]|nr:GIY-YIG nuclease superfamily protein [bacterium BMS3Abin06]HDZ01535.1 hypothetical protein [Nitrospirota bacterium]
MEIWFLYLIRCKDGSLYTGITTDVKRRFEEHKGGGRGSNSVGAGADTALFPLHLYNILSKITQSIE